MAQLLQEALETETEAGASDGHDDSRQPFMASHRFLDVSLHIAIKVIVMMLVVIMVIT